MNSKESYIPASELSEHDWQSLIWRVPLPEYAPAENILVNARRLGNLAYLSGMESLRIDGYAGDTTQVTPEIGSVDDHGIATATMKGTVSKAETFETDVSDANNPNQSYNYNWAKGKVSLNISEIEERVGQKGNLRNHKQWSKQLDKALREGVREAGWLSLIDKSPGKMVPLFYLSGSFGWNFLYQNRGEDLLIGSLMTYTSAALFGEALADKILGRSSGNFTDIIHSIFPGFPIDRFLAVNAISRTLPLVKAETERKK